MSDEPLRRKLYQFRDALERTMALVVDHETGEISPQADVVLGELEADWEDKAVSVALYAKSLRMEVEGVKREIARLQAIVARNERNAEWLEGYIHANKPPGFTHKDPRVSILEKESKVVTLEPGCSVADVDPEYLRVKPAPDPEIDKKAARKVLLAGGGIKGLRLHVTKRTEVK